MKFFKSVFAVAMAVFLGIALLASTATAGRGGAEITSGLLLADNPRAERRDGRQEDRPERRDDRQDCVQEEGRVGQDKRECKQEKRTDSDEVETNTAEKNA